MTPLLFLGEAPPPGAAPDFRPFDCLSGDRMARHMLGLRTRAPMLAHVRIANVFDEPGTGVSGKGPAWDLEAARQRGADILAEYMGGGAIVALGERPRAALGLAELRVGSMVRAPSAPQVLGAWVLAMPHPGGRGQALNTEPQRAAIRAALLPEVVASCPGLAPADFRLDEPAVLRDLAVAVSPLRPHVAAAALVIAAETKATVILRWLSAALGHVGDTPMDAAHRAGLAIGIGEDDPPRHRALRERARFAERTIDFASVDPHVLRATSLRLTALGVTP